MKLLNYVIGGFSVKKIITYTGISAAAGLGTGTCLKNLKEHPGTTHKIIGYSIVGGSIGGILGLGVGLWTGKKAFLLSLSQSMYTSLLTVCYCNVHSVFKNSDLKLPIKETPMNDVTIRTLSGGITGSIFGMIPGMRVFHMGMSGMLFGFFGHFIYERIRILRMEFLLRENYPELCNRVKESEYWMEDQCRSNPYYAGPVNPKPEWMQRVESLWGDYGKKDLNELQES